jgi:hypothetical protein
MVTASLVIIHPLAKSLLRFARPNELHRATIENLVSCHVNLVKNANGPVFRSIADVNRLYRSMIQQLTFVSWRDT